MATISSYQKIVLMGLGKSGKSTIKSIAFEGKSPADCQGYNATLNYERSTKRTLDLPYQIFDLGGQENFLTSFIGDQAEFIFSDVVCFVWVVDVSNFERVSNSKYYWDQALKKLAEYSPKAEVFCLFHKMDLIRQPMRADLIESMVDYFDTPNIFQGKTHIHGTSIYDESLFVSLGQIMQTILLKNSKTALVATSIDEFLAGNQEISGVAVFTIEDGLPVFENGKFTEKVYLPANLWLANYERLSENPVFSIKKTFKSTLEMDDCTIVFQKLRNDLLICTITIKPTPLQYMSIKMDEISLIVSELV